jgi:hypothetical protein
MPRQFRQCAPVRLLGLMQLAFLQIQDGLAEIAGRFATQCRNRDDARRMTPACLATPCQVPPA